MRRWFVGADLWLAYGWWALAALVTRVHGRAAWIDIRLLGNTGVHPIRTMGCAALRVTLFGSSRDIARRVFSRGRIGFLVTGA